MCDTQVIRKNQITLFAKNSDREPSEPQIILRVPAVNNDQAKSLRTTYLTIPQTKDRFGVLLSKPCWVWGAEMGANDQGVVIGNEAVFTNVHDATPGLIGLDLLRLALERGSSAQHALNVITELLEKYGQGGGCGYIKKNFSYDNSFIIADHNECWILETAARVWVAKKVDQFGAISNRLTINNDYQLKAKNLEKFAQEKGLLQHKRDLDFANIFGKWFFTYFSGSFERLNCSYQYLQKFYNNNFSAPEQLLKLMFNSLRQHRFDSNSHYLRNNSDICMHAAGYMRRAQTCGSMVSLLNKNNSENNSLHFFTGTSAPCTSLFRPINFNDKIDTKLLFNESEPADSLWHRHELIHRRLLFDHSRYQEFITTRNSAEDHILNKFNNLNNIDLDQAILDSDHIANQWHNYWYNYFRQRPIPNSFTPYGRFWHRLNRLDGIK